VNVLRLPGGTPIPSLARGFPRSPDIRSSLASDQIAPQFDPALRNVLAEAGGRPADICRITAYCCDKPAYLAARSELGGIWRRHMGKQFPAMSMIFVSDLPDSPGKIELEATAVVPFPPPGP
jgi:enamine deaminase RidA (YjgF/YER057c/UK114 family)